MIHNNVEKTDSNTCCYIRCAPGVLHLASKLSVMQLHHLLGLEHYTLTKTRVSVEACQSSTAIARSADKQPQLIIVSQTFTCLHWIPVSHALYLLGTAWIGLKNHVANRWVLSTLSDFFNIAFPDMPNYGKTSEMSSVQRPAQNTNLSGTYFHTT